MKLGIRKITTALALVASTQASAYNLDTFLTGVDSTDSGASTTLNWIKGFLNDNSIVQLGGDTNSWSYAGGQYYSSIDADTDYFVVKTGNIKTLNGWDTFLFQNVAELNLAVVEKAQFCGTDTGCQFNIGKFSHLRTYDNDTTQVPEPGSLGLLAAGLFGLVAARRFAKQV